MQQTVAKLLDLRLHPFELAEAIEDLRRTMRTAISHIAWRQDESRSQEAGFWCQMAASHWMLSGCCPIICCAQKAQDGVAKFRLSLQGCLSTVAQVQ